VSNQPELSILEAIRSALTDEMGRDERVMVLGMNVGQLGGVFRGTRGLAIGGMVPVAEIQFLAAPPAAAEG